MLCFFKADARRTVQLANDHALGAVDHKTAALSHERNFAHEKRVFTQILALAQLERHIERRRKGFAFANRFQMLQFWFLDFVAYEIKGDLSVIALDRESLAQHRLQTHLLPLGRRCVLLKEVPVGVKLDFN